MGNLKDIQSRANSLREQEVELKQQIRVSNANIENIKAQIRDLKKSGLDKSDRKILKLEQELISLSSDKNRVSENLIRNNEQFNDLRTIVKNDFNPILDVEQLSDDYSILLFPLRLETRFSKTGNQNQLWLRVYPDECNVVKNEPLLSADELSNVRIFWAEMTKAGKIESEERGAWKVFAKSHGSNRASWIIQQYRPSNEIIARIDDSYKVLVLIDTNDTPSELNLEAVNYWKEVWQAKGDDSKIQIARTKLEALVTNDAYTYYIGLSPYNLSDFWEEAVDVNKISVAKINLPNPDLIQTTSSSWNEAPQVAALPDKFVAITYSNGRKNTHVFENGIKNNLTVGLDPSLEADEISKDDSGIQLNEELRWMVDFEEAVNVGMGTRINLTTAEAENGFDQLFVIGLRVSSDPGRSVAVLEDLITSHKNSIQGFSFIKQGTPTNNTEDEPSGYSRSEDIEECYDRLFKGTENFIVSGDNKTQSDAQRFADSLNVNSDILQGLPNANGKDQLESIAMNTALFPATMGYFMEEMMDPLFSESDIEATRKIFVNSISGRGPIPAIKIGKQPYGILPITRFSNLKFRKDQSFENKVVDLINSLDRTWDSTVSQVNYIGKEGDPHQILLDVLGLHSNSVEFHQRYAQSIEQVYNQMRISVRNPIIAGLITAIIASRGKQILQSLGLNPETNLPILKKFFLSKPNKLTGPLIDDVPDSEVDPIRPYTSNLKNYLEWLQSADGNKIRLQDFDGNPVPNALLYLLLRHSVLLAQANSGTNLLIKEKLIDSKKVFHDPAFLNIQEVEIGKSKFEHLYQTNNKITGNSSTSLIEHIYKRDILNNTSETRILSEVLQSLKVLEKTPTARLERLLVEHLDCCTYRIDSWKTGLTYEQVKYQQAQVELQQKENGIFLGAYGWLLDLRPKKSSLQQMQLNPEDANFFSPKGEKVYSDSNNLGYIHAPSVDQAATAAILRNAYDSNRDTGDRNPFAINLTSERVRIALDFLEGIRNGQSLSALLGYQFERGLHDRYQSTGIEADKFIYPLRLAFPLVTDHLKSSQTTDADIQDALETNNANDFSIEAIEGRNVVDGLKLIQQIQNNSIKIYPFGKSNLPSANSNERNAITEEVNRLIDINDAIVDLLMAEQVYQTVKGNFDRSAAVANAYSKGTYPPEMEVVNTPRSGLNLNHKVAIHFDAEASVSVSPNSIGNMTPRAQSEASVNKWLSDILPSPENVQVKIEVQLIEEVVVERDPDDKIEIKVNRIKIDPIFVSQKDLGIQSIDLLFSATLDNEQAMTELDDRIVNFLLNQYRDSSGNSLNPFAEISILYTEEIDPVDKSKVSFFELGSTLNSLRKILVNRPYVNHTSIQLPTERTVLSNIGYDIEGLNDVINKLKTDLGIQKLGLRTITDTVVSIQSLVKKQEVILLADNINATSIERLNQYLNDALKNYLLNQTPETRTDSIHQFVELLDRELIVDPVKSILITDFGSYLDNYVSDFSNISDLVKDTCDKFMAIAWFDNDLSGTGFIHQAIGGIYASVIDKIKVVIHRWATKNSEFSEIMSEYISGVSDEDKIQLLQRAERKISSSGTYPVPSDIILYKASVETQKEEFDGVFNQLKEIPITNLSSLSDFISNTNLTLSRISDYDIVSYDIDNNRNDLVKEVKTMILLKEDICSAHLNLLKHLENKLNNCESLVSEISTLNSDNEKIGLLLNAAKILLTEDLLILPKLKFSSEFANTVSLAYDKKSDIQEFSKVHENRLFPVDDWFAGVARVRDNLWHFENALSLLNGFKPDSNIEIYPLQFPIRDQARWLAMKFIAVGENIDEYIKSLEGDSLLYTAHFAEVLDTSKPTCGIIVDEWTEVIPFKEETTGVAFHFDQPNSEPPQTILLVAPSEITGKWNWEDLVGALEETLAMTKKRAIEPSMIDSSTLGQFLPTTLMAVSSHWITVAMNLSLNNLPISNDQ